MSFSSKWHLIVHLKRYSFLLWSCHQLSFVISLLLFFNRNPLLDSHNMCPQRKRRVVVWSINGPSISAVILITVQRNIIFLFPLGVIGFNVQSILAFAIWRLRIKTLNRLLLCLPLKIWKYFVYVYSMLSCNFAFRESKIFTLHLMRKLSTHRQKFERGEISKILQDSYAVFMVRIMTTAMTYFHGLSSRHKGVR